MTSKARASLSLAFAVSVVDLALYGVAFLIDAMLRGGFTFAAASEAAGTEVAFRLFFLQIPLQIVLLSFAYRWFAGLFVVVSVVASCASTLAMYAALGLGVQAFVGSFVVRCELFGCALPPGLVHLATSAVSAALVWALTRSRRSPNYGLHRTAVNRNEG